MATYKVDRIQVIDALSEDCTVERFVTKYAIIDGVNTAVKQTMPINSKKFSDLSPQLRQLIEAELTSIGAGDIPEEA